MKIWMLLCAVCVACSGGTFKPDGPVKPAPNVEAACENMQALKCMELDDCERALSGPIEYNVDCIAGAESCEAADAC